MCDSVLDQELDFTVDQELPDDIGTQMVFMSQREGRPYHFSWHLLHTNSLQRDTTLKSGRRWAASSNQDIHHLLTYEAGCRSLYLFVIVLVRYEKEVCICKLHSVKSLLNPRWFGQYPHYETKDMSSETLHHLQLSRS